MDEEQFLSSTCRFPWLVLLGVVFLGLPAIHGDSGTAAGDTSAKPETSQQEVLLRYAPEEGAQWKDTSKRTIEADVKMPFNLGGQGGAKQEKTVNLTMFDQLEARTTVKKVDEDQIHLKVRIQRYLLDVNTTFFNLLYDSKKDTSGIYDDIFSHLIEETIHIVINARGEVQEVNGLEEVLKSARKELPTVEGGGGLSSQNIVVRFLDFVLKRENLMSFFMPGWVELPEKRVSVGNQWGGELQIFHFMDFPNIGEVRHSFELAFKEYSESEALFNVFAEFSILQWKSVEKKGKGKEPSGTFKMTPGRGVTELNFRIRVRGGDEDKQAKFEFSFNREPVKK